VNDPEMNILNRPDKPYNERQRKKSKSKAIPLQAWTGPDGSRKLRLPDFKTVSTCRW
jgi:hypothetical protein